MPPVVTSSDESTPTEAVGTISPDQAPAQDESATLTESAAFTQTPAQPPDRRPEIALFAIVFIAWLTLVALAAWLAIYMLRRRRTLRERPPRTRSRKPIDAWAEAGRRAELPDDDLDDDQPQVSPWLAAEPDDPSPTATDHHNGWIHPEDDDPDAQEDPEEDDDEDDDWDEPEGPDEEDEDDRQDPDRRFGTGPWMDPPKRDG